MKELDALIKKLSALPFDEKIEAINLVREKIHEISPFKNEPVDFVRWVKSEMVIANDYNPNKVAPPEMQLLEVSIIEDGYTQPIVGFSNEGHVEVVDGFHRNRVGKESLIVRQRVNGYLPVVDIRNENKGKDARIASTIRHNRARGKHQISAMSEIVIELKNRNWNNARIARELGMDEDEILRLCQISGLEGMFSDRDFSRAWIANNIDETFEALTDEIDEEELGLTKIPNEGDENRIFHTYDKWEAVEYGFFNSTHPTLSNEQCRWKYKELLSVPDEFERVLQDVFEKWKYSCEHNLTNRSLNRIAWLGQAAVCYKYKVPAIFSSGWDFLTEEEKDGANQVAFQMLNKWLTENGLPEVSFEEAMQIERQVELY